MKSRNFLTGIVAALSIGLSACSTRLYGGRECEVRTEIDVINYGWTHHRKVTITYLKESKVMVLFDSGDSGIIGDSKSDYVRVYRGENYLEYRINKFINEEGIEFTEDSKLGKELGKTLVENSKRKMHDFNTIYRNAVNKSESDLIRRYTR